MAEEWLTTAEAAELSGYHENYIRRIVRAGKVKAQKFGPTWQVSRESLIQYLDTAAKSTDKRWGPKRKTKYQESYIIVSTIEPISS